MKRVYFYKDGNILKRYTYCSMCLAGPFKEEDENYEFIKLGGKNTPINYCRYCASMKNYDKNFLKRDPPVSNPLKLYTRPVFLSHALKNIEKETFEENEEKIDGQQYVENDPVINMKTVSVEDILNKEIEETDLIEETENDLQPLDYKDFEDNFLTHFIVVKCKDGALYSSVTELSIRKSLKNMDLGKGPDFTKPTNKRPVSLVLCIKVKNKLEGKRLKTQFVSLDKMGQKKFIKNNLK